jgi:hypothetical protein
VFFAVSADEVAATFELRATFDGQSPFDVSQRQMHRDHVFVHRFVTTDAEVGQTERIFEVPIDYLTRPTPTIALQGSLWLADKSRPVVSHMI